jgi:hypothetical protein
LAPWFLLSCSLLYLSVYSSKSQKNCFSISLWQVMLLSYKIRESQGQWHMSTIPSTLEAKTGRSFDLMSSRSACTT